MTDINLDRELARAINNLNQISKVAVPRASRRAVNRVSRKAITASTREAAKKAKVPKKLVDKKVSMLKANTSYNYSKIRVDRRGISAIKLPKVHTRYRRRRGRIVRGSSRIKAGRHTFERAFVQKVGGNWHVMQRKTSNRYPIDVVRVPIKNEVTSAFERNIDIAMNDEMPKAMKTELAKEMSRVIK